MVRGVPRARGPARADQRLRVSSSLTGERRLYCGCSLRFSGLASESPAWILPYVFGVAPFTFVGDGGAKYTDPGAGGLRVHCYKVHTRLYCLDHVEPYDHHGLSHEHRWRHHHAGNVRIQPGARRRVRLPAVASLDEGTPARASASSQRRGSRILCVVVASRRLLHQLWALRHPPPLCQYE